MKKRLGLIAVIRETCHFIEEWLWFHHFAGIEKFMIAVNADDPLGFQEIYEKVKELPFAEDICLHQYCRNCCNAEMYRRLIEQYKTDVQWMILAETCEFFFSPEGLDLKDVLRPFDRVDCGGIIIPCTQMGLNGFVHPPPLPVTDHILLQQPRPQQSQYKVIFKTSAYTGCDYDWFVNVSKPYLYQDGECIMELATSSLQFPQNCLHFVY